MIDIETMGGQDDAKIVAIGAIGFTQEGIVKDTEFYRTIPIDCETQRNRSMDPETVRWWTAQSDKARAELQPQEFDVTLLGALNDLGCYLEQHNVPTRKKGHSIWVNGATFDFRILRHAFLSCGFSVPWHRKAECCMRALRLMGQQVQDVFPNYGTMKRNNSTCERTGRTPHNALHDAMTQAEYVVGCMRSLKLIKLGV
jgi:DNA polymerase III epsilon subunit-like protein